MTWVFHRGALGDSVLVWPMMRALRRAGMRVMFVADGAKARLAAAELGVEGVDAEERRFAELWVDGSRPRAESAERVVTFMADESSAPGRVWMANARAMFPGAALECVPGPIDRVTALRLAAGKGDAPVRENGSGPVVLHVGAGSAPKRWAMERWEELAARVGGEAGIAVIAGEVEAEQFGAAERAAMSRLGGRYVTDLAELAAVVRGALVFVGCDSGPTHLAAQLGVATVALFGPTDPQRWAPIGPRVTVIAPEASVGMDWLSVGRARAAVAAAANGPADDRGPYRGFPAPIRV